MSPSRFSITTTSRLVRPLSNKETICCSTYLDIAAMMHHTNLRTYVQTIIKYIRAWPYYFFEDAEFRSFAHLRKASSEQDFCNIGRSLPICGEAAPQTPVRKNIPKGGVIFKDMYRINTNMYVESFHWVLKVICLEHKQNRKLDRPS